MLKYLVGSLLIASHAFFINDAGADAHKAVVVSKAKCPARLSVAELKGIINEGTPLTLTEEKIILKSTIDSADLPKKNQLKKIPNEKKLRRMHHEMLDLSRDLCTYQIESGDGNLKFKITATDILKTPKK